MTIRDADRILDEIDRLVDEQMADGEPRVGYDFGDPTYPRCPHCDRHWHGLPITERIAAMYANGIYDEDYRADTDTSRVLCQGSDFIGPMPAEIPPGLEWLEQWIQRDIALAHRRAIHDLLSGYRLALTPELQLNVNRRWWRTTLPDNAEITEDMERFEFTVVVGDASQTFKAEHLRRNGNVVDVLADFAPSIGGTWEPLTAPGVVTHPVVPQNQRRAIAQIPQRGSRVSFVDVRGRIITGTVANVETDEETGVTDMTLTRFPEFAPGEFPRLHRGGFR
ncbi:hypothetical protein [Mycobacterium branderi]|uniref:Uncharacterized protein n=1 Tax=Mycobacterium branderi TaxID=43348 RepID=A0ABM7KF47_9MYCO|nr:hypothetical protein [Mycobacterium branderi]BBZ09813.1 hypothetical protein MBRA_00080 [Mycobacterium branderi]